MDIEKITLEQLKRQYDKYKYLVGLKQVIKILTTNPKNIKCVILAKNIDDEIWEQVKLKAMEANVKLFYIESSFDLKEYTNIDVPASVLVILDK